MVFVPWPISVEAVRIRNVPSARASTPIVPCSFFSPPPVKPDPGQDHRRQRAIGPTIHDDLDVLADQCSIFFDCRTVRDDTWMTLGCRREIFMPVVNQPDGPARLAGEQRGMNRHDRGILLLAPE